MKSGSKEVLFQQKMNQSLTRKIDQGKIFLLGKVWDNGMTSEIYVLFANL